MSRETLALHCTRTYVLSCSTIGDLKTEGGFGFSWYFRSIPWVLTLSFEFEGGGGGGGGSAIPETSSIRLYFLYLLLRKTLTAFRSPSFVHSNPFWLIYKASDGCIRQRMDCSIDFRTDYASSLPSFNFYLRQQVYILQFSV